MHDFVTQNPDVLTKLHALLIDAIQFVLLALVSGATWAVKLYINQMNSSWKKAIAQRLVAFAEQRLEKNADKLTFATEKLQAHLGISNDEAHHLVEEAVVNLKTKLGGSDDTTKS